MLDTTERQERIRLLFQYYADELYSYVQCLAPREIDPKDIVQDTFVRAFLNLHRLRDETLARAWLYRITRNLLFDELRRRRIEVTCFQRLPKQAMVHTPDTSLEIYDAIRSLPLHYQHVLYLRFVQDFALQEIASILHKTPVSVRVTLHRARNALTLELEFTIQSPYQSSASKGDVKQ